ncbi:MAG: two component transcriptional regulator, winged helix family [Rickettsiales bacterium]|jgi:two-component system KDP operon response regulator KdpE|nr:two component transcriptional regulator, winged helix family [Rickettsiales bacterium]
MKLSKPTVLIIDDEPQIRKMIEVTLSACNFKVVEAESGNEGIRLAGSHKPDVIILDLGLPDMDGIEVLKRLRQWSDIPVVVVSARSDASDIVDAFEQGADDYMTKPFDMKVLIARLNTAMKHIYQKELGDSTLAAGGIVIDFIRHEVTVRGTRVDFSPKEYELLSYLIRHQGKMLTHRQLLKAVWGDAHAEDKQYLRVYIMQVRQKIEADPENPEYIITEAGIGYRFDAPKQAVQDKKQDEVQAVA